MGSYGGLAPYPRRYGGGRTTTRIALDALNAGRGTGYSPTWESKVYVHNLSIARAIAAAWGTNERLRNIWDPWRMPQEVLVRWERMLAMPPRSKDTWLDRRRRLAKRFLRFGRASFKGYLEALLEDELGNVFVAVENIDYSIASITVPDGSYPWGTPSLYAPWSSSVAHVLVRLQKPAGFTEAQFYAAAAKVIPALDPALPVWSTVAWYRPGPINTNVPGGPSAAGFYLDTPANLDNQVLRV